MSMHNAYRETRFRAKLVIGMTVFGALTGFLTYLGYLSGYPENWGIVEHGRFFYELVSNKKSSGVFQKEFALAALAGALALGLPALIFVAKTKGKGKKND